MTGYIRMDQSTITSSELEKCKNLCEAMERELSYMELNLRRSIKHLAEKGPFIAAYHNPETFGGLTAVQSHGRILSSHTRSSYRYHNQKRAWNFPRHIEKKVEEAIDHCLKCSPPFITIGDRVRKESSKIFNFHWQAMKSKRWSTQLFEGLFGSFVGRNKEKYEVEDEDLLRSMRQWCDEETARKIRSHRAYVRIQVDVAKRLEEVVRMVDKYLEEHRKDD